MGKSSDISKNEYKSASVRDVFFCHLVESQPNWINRPDFQKLQFTHDFCKFVLMIALSRDDPQVSPPSEGMSPSHKVTEPMPRMGHDYPFNPFWSCRSGKKWL